MEFNEKAPIYVQIMDSIQRDIVRGVIKGGDKLPSVRELSERFRVNPNTVQRAYQELERQGITFTQRGMGTFVTEDENKIKLIKREMSKEVIELFVGGMKDLGFSKEEILEIVEKTLGEGDI